MIRHNIKNYIRVLVVLSLVIFYLIFKIQGHDEISLKINIVIGDVSKTVLLLSIITSLFISFGWKWKIFKGWLVVIPNITGKWKGTMYSDYTDPPMEIPAEVEIKQSFFRTTVKLKTGESKSNNIVASFNIDKDISISQLIYTYYNIPNATVRTKSPIHYGTIVLNISRNETELTGFYWTGRKTTGDIKLTKENDDKGI